MSSPETVTAAGTVDVARQRHIDGEVQIADMAGGGMNAAIGILLALKAANQPPDEDHPYGHHSFETLGAIIVALFRKRQTIQVDQHNALRN